MTRAFKMTTVIILSAFIFAGSKPARGESTEDAQARYQACMDKIQSNAEAAFDDATAWEGLGGGYPARHCALAALVKIGHYSEAAQGLEKLADLVHANKAFKAQLLVQSARAWIAANDPGHASAVTDAALKLSPNEPHILLVHAQALALQGAYGQAVDELNRILDAKPDAANPFTDKTFVEKALGVEALVMRGAANRQLDKLDLALTDLDLALSLDPDHPEGLLERGIVHRLAGRTEAARGDWNRLMEAAPDTPAARAAAANVHLLDSGVKRGPQNGTD